MKEYLINRNDTFPVPNMHIGMTLRDYFAAKANDRDIAEYMPLTFGEAKLRPHATRQWARYQHADAMMKAREA